MLVTVKQLLIQNGYTVKNLTERLWKKNVMVSYEMVKHYCRSWSTDFGDPDVWAVIRECLREMEVNW
jgi:hypothetical protein|nr:MAG TPA: hypothetical protein [Caudoviricetes sp.]